MISPQIIHPTSHAVAPIHLFPPPPPSPPPITPPRPSTYSIVPCPGIHSCHLKGFESHRLVLFSPAAPPKIKNLPGEIKTTRQLISPHYLSSHPCHSSKGPADDANCSGAPSGGCGVGRCWEACSSWVPVPLFGLSSWLAG